MVLRLDTGDAVRSIDNEEHTCTYAHLPATSRVLGKMELSVVAPNGRRFFQRDILELLEDELAIPQPCRYALQPQADGFALHLLVSQDDAQLSEKITYPGCAARPSNYPTAALYRFGANANDDAHSIRFTRVDLP